MRNSVLLLVQCICICICAYTIIIDLVNMIRCEARIQGQGKWPRQYAYSTTINKNYRARMVLGDDVKNANYIRKGALALH